MCVGIAVALHELNQGSKHVGGFHGAMHKYDGTNACIDGRRVGGIGIGLIGSVVGTPNEGDSAEGKCHDAQFEQGFDKTLHDVSCWECESALLNHHHCGDVRGAMR